MTRASNRRAARRAERRPRKLDPAPYCPRCDVMLSGVSVFDGPGGLAPKPRNGDVSVCTYCTAVLEFREVAGGLALVELTGAEYAKILTDPDPALDPIRATIAIGPIPPPPGSRRH